MALRTGLLVAVACLLAWPGEGRADDGRPALEALRVPPGGSEENVALGDRIFHGEAAGGRCASCHGWDAKGTGNGNDLTSGMWIWGDGSLRMIRERIRHGMTVAPGMDGDLTPPDVDAVAEYVWAISHQDYR
jgi:mono/diheme cytochrome c family protein